MQLPIWFFLSQRCSLTVEGAKDRFMRTKGRGPIASPVAPRIDLMVENASAPPRGVIFGRDELAGLV
jgi:hypothetical protein